jgi:hypothetical protein
MNEIAIQDINGLTLPDGSTVTTSIYFNRESADAFIFNLRNFALSIDRDITTKKGRENVASIAYKIAQMKKPIELAGKAIVEDKKQEVKAVDNERIRLDKLLDELKNEVRQPLTDFENAEKERVNAHEADIAIMKELAVFSFAPDVTNISVRIDRLLALIQKDYQEFAVRAKTTFDETNAILVKMLADEQQKESDRIELERLRKEKEERERIEREERIAREAKEQAEREAAEKAKLEAERMERMRLEALRKAEEEKQALLKKAEDDAIKAKFEAEAKAKAETERAEREKRELEARILKAEQDKKDAIETERKRIADEKAKEELEKQKREANIKHRNKIYSEAFEDLMKIVNDAEICKNIIASIDKKEISHISIEY